EQPRGALVRTHEGLPEAGGAEELRVPLSPLRVARDHRDLPFLVGAPAERAAGKPARRYRLAAERERVAEGCERLVREARIPGLEKRGPRGERSPPVVGDASGMSDGFSILVEDGRERGGVAGGGEAAPPG